MDFNTKKFWLAQALELIITICMFTKMIDFNSWILYTTAIEGGWATLDTASKFAKKGGGQ